ncbi:hypothetical protein KEM48_001607 [Puccinia striiformis f. sp. tritici PST-130]|nr:hypothetical protein H4Q26_000101 [Puccinia striiformis f. sp. tritici PST-130]KAI9607052.1 hypothetical protein KEM48_001607 [Puccinia striiformis f. sp. tritici PST-130]
MLSSSSFTSLEKAIINHVLPSDHHRILAAGLCSIYHAYPDPNKCTLISGTRGTIWEHEVYEDGPGKPGHGHFGYHQECTFWHAFQGDDCMITFVFVNEDEALVIFWEL